MVKTWPILSSKHVNVKFKLYLKYATMARLDLRIDQIFTIFDFLKPSLSLGYVFKLNNEFLTFLLKFHV